MIKKQIPIFERKISLFKNIFEPQGKVVTLGEFLRDTTKKDEILRLRAMVDAEKQKTLKKWLPQATISGTFRGRTADSLIEHSGLICVDIDGKENPGLEGDWEEIKQQLAKVPQIAYASLSVRGNGLFCIIPLAYPDLHLQQFLKLEEDFKSMGITIDASCKNINRLRIISYDPRAIMRPEAVPYEGFKVIEKPHHKPYRASTGVSDTIDKVARYCEEIDRRGIDITDSYENWFKVGSALASLGEAGREFFHLCSRQNAHYNAKETDEKFSNILNTIHKWSIGTFFYLAEQAGVCESIRNLRRF